MIAGAIAGSATVILTNPIWVVNTRMTTRKAAAADDDDKNTAALPGAPPAKKPSTIGTLLALLKNEGPQALFAGVVPALVLVINPILQYTLFEQMKNAVEKRRKMTATLAFFLGAAGKLFATSVTYPYITVKSQMHVAPASDGTGTQKREGMMEAINRVVREEGYAGLYKGMSLPLYLDGSVTMDGIMANRGQNKTGIGPKVTQSVLTAAFLFAFKDVLYEQTVKLRGRVTRKALA